MTEAQQYEGFTDEERDAMKERAKEPKAAKRGSPADKKAADEVKKAAS